MANIPVERTGSGILPWLLGLGALALLGFLAFLFFDSNDTPVDALPDEPAPVAAAATDELDLSDVYVTRVVSDDAFFVAPTEGGSDETLVYADGGADVAAGQRVAIAGSMEDTPADLSPWGLTAEQAADVGDTYVQATGVTVLGDGAAADGAAADGGGLAMLDGDLAAMAGQAIALDGVRVVELTGDSTFAVGEGDRRTVVVLESLGEDETGPGDGSDGRFDVNVGDVVDIDGTVTAFRRGMRGTSDLSDDEAGRADARRYVVVVSSADGFSKR